MTMFQSSNYYHMRTHVMRSIKSLLLAMVLLISACTHAGVGAGGGVGIGGGSSTGIGVGVGGGLRF